jgi:hypothetical protein
MRYRWQGAALVVLLVTGFAAPEVLGQDVSGALRGRVVSPDSRPLAGVLVKASGPSLPQPVAVESDARGNVRLLSLPVGTYSVLFRAIGYGPIRYDGVSVRLGRTTDLGRIVLEPRTVELPEITVAARTSPIDPITTTSGTTVSADVFDALPLDRSFRSIVALGPGANSQPPNIARQSEGVNISGGSVWDNAYFVDGVDVTDPYRGASGTNLPYNFLQAVEVKTAGYEAEYGRALGGVVNMVTPSGGNRFEGEAFSFVSDHRLRTAARYGLREPNLNSYTQFDVGLALSGPFRRDRLWFYVAYNPIIDNRTASYTGMAATRDRQIQHRFAGKLTWQPRATTRIALTTTGDPSWHDAVGPGDFGSPVSVLNSDVVLGRLREGGATFSLRGTQVQSKLLLEGVLSRSWFREDRVPQTSLGATAPLFVDTNGAASGGFGGGDREHLGRTSLQLSSTLATGLHTFKAGLEYQNNTLDSHIDEGRDSIGGVIYQFSDSEYYWDRIQGQAHVGNRVYTAFAQDSWEVSHWLRLNGGLRWEEQAWVDANGVRRQTIAGEWSPRLGFIISPGPRGSQKVFGSAGRFYEQVPLGALGFFYGSGSFSETFYPQDPRADTAGAVPYVLQAGGVRQVPGLRGEYYDEVTLGYERLLGSGVKAGLHGTYRVLRSVIEDTQIFGDTDVVGNPGRGRLSEFPTPNHKYRAIELTLERAGRGPLYLRASYVLSRNTGNYNGLWVGDGQLANAGSQFDNHDSLVISTGPLPNDRTHVVKLMGSYRLRFGLTLGMYGAWQSGTPLNEYGLNGGSLAFLRPRGSAGRTPSLWDLSLRLDYRVPRVAVRGAATRVILDLEHIGSPRRPVAVDQLHYFGLGPQNGTNPRYGQATVNQPPMSLRLGVVTGF